MPHNSDIYCTGTILAPRMMGKKFEVPQSFFGQKTFQAPESFFFWGGCRSASSSLMMACHDAVRTHTDTPPQPDLRTLIISYFNLTSPDVSFRIIPSLELTYPTLGKGLSSTQKCHSRDGTWILRGYLCLQPWITWFRPRRTGTWEVCMVTDQGGFLRDLADLGVLLRHDEITTLVV